VALFREHGAEDVRTYVQSGNVVFRAATAAAARLGSALEQRLARELGVPVPLVLRRAADLARLLRANPFRAQGIDPSELHVAFLAARPTRARLAALDPRRSPGDALCAVGSEVFLHLPNGVARTKLTNAYLDSTLGTISTVRNWRTVEALAALAAGKE
jgi:uncharacterized protein (DUF1697 family)